MSAYFQVKAYHRPQDLSQALELLSGSETIARVIAGGTDIQPRRDGVKKFDLYNQLVDISNLDIDYLKEDRNHIRICAATPKNSIGTSALL